ncbi:hypothetical protein [Prevotella ihumii]|uniref:hypothetical protein n=1 Tax=Prevotella ihumii TaxID=1917878 RepID=UPI00098245BD|nr:hypothetical protein [Prevotella ihumii]
MDLQEYKQLILDDLLTRITKSGEPMIDEHTAIELLNSIDDEDLLDGMLFNEPKDVADVIIESL